MDIPTIKLRLNQLEFVAMQLIHDGVDPAEIADALEKMRQSIEHGFGDKVPELPQRE